MMTDSKTTKGATYNYEALLDEQFQNLVQALLVKSYPDLQCFPVGMPDGGRDAASNAAGNSEDGSIVFQVKFSRNPSTLKDVFKWIKGAIDGERTKVERLASEGASKYILITNINGTSHFKTGTIDQVNSYAKETLPIPFECIWRDDLDRRLDGEFDLKLRFPHLLNGPDLLRLAWESPRGSETLKRSRRTVEAYLKHQHRTDEMLRFKQVDMLTTKLFDLFIDVPIQLISSSSKIDSEKHSGFSGIMRRIAERTSSDSDHFHHQIEVQRNGRRVQIGAADLLTDPLFTMEANRIVIEGAPGQGKSTLSQYLVQIQRARYLEKPFLLKKLPKEHVAGPIYLPLKLELRDLAVWLKGDDPWEQDPASQKHNQPISLEAALTAHVRRYSGGGDFSVSDLQEIIHSIPTLLILDALDEVADLDDRANVIQEVEAASARMESTPGSLVIIATSRPTALSNAPTFSKRSYTHFSLSAINPDLAVQYARKWSTARGVVQRDYLEIDAILKTKLQTPHMAELAKNTMQLTILLGLILSRGSSLPDKRTELYSAYLEQFLSRESDKDLNVRENRELIVDIHGYLGYYIHARAEGQRDSGRIGHEELRTLLTNYLEGENRDTSLVDALFMAVVERVVALVSRVEGTFEFEVQPLREYFAGRHLYHTASYSPPGREKKGTKPDRFDGIAPNPYWLNVARFFAGFFSKGELMDLADRVCELIEGQPNGETYPRRLALALLQDWVFSQSPRAAEMVVRAMLRGPGLKWALCATSAANQVSSTRPNQSIFYLSPGGGGAEYAQEIFFKELASNLDNDATSTICSLLQEVSSRNELSSYWKDRYSQASRNDQLTTWLNIGRQLGVYSSASEQDQLTLIATKEGGDLGQRIDSVLSSYDPLERLDKESWKAAVRSALEMSGSRKLTGSDTTVTDIFLTVTHPRLWEMVVRREFPARAIIDLTRRDATEIGWRHKEIQRLSESCDIISSTSMNNRKPSIMQALDVVTGEIEKNFGVTWNSVAIGSLATNVISRAERGAGVTSLIKDAMPLPQRFRFARRQAKRVDWWSKQLELVEDRGDAIILLSALRACTSPESFIAISERLSPLLSSLSSQDFTALINFAVDLRRGRKSLIADSSVFESLTRAKQKDIRYLQYLLSRAEGQLAQTIVDRLIENLDDPLIARQCHSFIATRLTSASSTVMESLALLSRCASSTNLLASNYEYLATVSKQDARRIPAAEIVGYGSILPISLLSTSFKLVDLSTGKPKAVAVIAEKEDWFATRL